MKKIFILLITFLCLKASTIEYYLFSVKMNYEEFDSSGQYLDSEKNSFGDLNGIGVKFTAKQNYHIFFKGEFAKGFTNYNGSTWGGESLNLKRKNVYIYNLEVGLAPFNNPFYMSLGYRFWQRGKSDYIGDYNEQYYWPFLGFGSNYLFNLKNIIITTDFEYQYTFNPKLDVELGSGTTLNLGTTTGFKLQFASYFKYRSNIYFSLMYRYQFWHINPSNSKEILLNGSKISIYEPESYTRNQYVGVGVLYKF